jgi:YVTN family beta-propeller protein
MFNMKAVLKELALLGFGLGLSVSAVADHHLGVAYVTNQDKGVSVISLENFSVIDTIDIEAKEPRGLGITDDGKLLITANREGGDVSVIDTATKKVVKHIPIGQNPEFVRVVGNFAYVSYEPSAKAGPPPKPGEKEDDDDGPKLPAGIAVIDIKAMKVVKTIMSGPETEGIEFSHDGKSMLVTNEGDNTITVYNLKSGKLVSKIGTHKLGDRPRGIKKSPDGKNYVVSLEYGDKILLLDKKFKPVKTVDTAKGPYGIAFDKSGKRLLVAAFKAKELQVFNGQTLTLEKTVPIGDRCWHFTFTPDEKNLLIACGRSQEVLVLDGTTFEAVGHVKDLNLPWGIVAYPKAMGSLDAAK